jgi:hypothetical protein
MAEPFQVATAQAVEFYDLVALQSNTIVRASDITWASAVATPSAPTLADGGINVGTGLTNALTAVKISYQFPWGEGPLSAAATVTPTANATIKASGLAPAAPALWTNLYVETAAGSGTFKLFSQVYGDNTQITQYGNGPVPSASPQLSGALQITQYNFAQLFAGVCNQRKVANLARIFGNSVDNMIMVNRGGNWEFDTASFAYSPGMWVGPAKDVGNVLLNQTVVQVPHPSLAIGKVQADSNVQGVLQATIKVSVDVLSTLVPVVPNLAALASVP